MEAWPEVSKVLEEQPEISVSCEWRVLRFNNETRQSVAKVLLLQEDNAKEPLLMQIPNCLAFECKYTDFALGFIFGVIGHAELLRYAIRILNSVQKHSVFIVF